MSISRTTLCLVVWAGVACLSSAAPVHDYGCFGSAGEDLQHRDYVRALGPIVEWSGQGDEPAMRAVRPFFAHEENARTGRDELDILWPVGTIRHWRNETDWRFLTAIYHDPDSADPASEYRFWILPIFALGRGKAGDDYGAVFPLGGRIDNWFGRDRVEFALFPLYWHSELNSLRTDHWLWPFISRTTGNDVSRFRVFPFYGRSEKKGEGASKFILWPFWTSSRYDRPKSKGGGFMLFPIYGHSKTEAGETWMFIPPFIRHSTGKTGTENVYLWPFVQTAKTKHEDKFYVWPLYGRRTTPDETRRFWLWPIVSQRQEQHAAADMRSFRFFPFVYSESDRGTAPVTNVTHRFVSVWPLVSYDRTKDERKRVRIPDLWPFRNTPPIERNLAPLWTVYHYERTPMGRENKVLWGMARWGVETNGMSYGSVFPLVSWKRDSKADSERDWEFLKGMLGYERNESGKTWRALYLLHWRTKP